MRKTSPLTDDTSGDTSEPTKRLFALRQSWVGERNIHSINVCTVDLTENGTQVTEEDNPNNIPDRLMNCAMTAWPA